MKQDWDGGFCEDTLSFYPIGRYIPIVPNDIGIMMALSGVLNVIMSLITVMWIRSQEKEAQAENGREDAVKSVIFPVFVNVLWCSAFVNIYNGVITALVPVNPLGDNGFLVSAVYASIWGLQHAVLEGIAFLLMQKGCGQHAASRAGKMAVGFGLYTFVVFFFCFSTVGTIQGALEMSWDFVLLVFFAALWLAPQKKFFRRPAAVLYGKFWFLYRLLVVITNILLFFNETHKLGSCGYILCTVFLFAIFQPLVCYWTLLQDSRWWQGLDIAQGRRRNNSDDDIRQLLAGSDFSLFSAQSLATTMDEMRVQGQVKMLNFACIKLDQRRPLGSGSFSKVYKGTYRGKECAVKLIYTVDLTADVIKRVAAEASILSSIRSPNIVHIFGVSVLPPSVCLILELCSFGSLSDIIRGYGFDWSSSHRAPLNLSSNDVIYLALGCARGLAAVHAFDPTVCHRDVKSFNFLVDNQFNVKIADLELGISNGSYNISNYDLRSSVFDTAEEQRLAEMRERDPELVIVEALLANWLAPEVLKNRKFQQASDIFSLGTVLWEVISGQLPFDVDTQPEIRRKIVSGFRHPIPALYRNSPIANLIARCWKENPSERPTADEVVSGLEVILNDQCYCLIGNVEGVPNTSSLRDFYEQNFRASNTNSVFGDGSVSHRRATMSFSSIFPRFGAAPAVDIDRESFMSNGSDPIASPHTSVDRGSHLIHDSNISSSGSSASTTHSNAIHQPLLQSNHLDNPIKNDSESGRMSGPFFTPGSIGSSSKKKHLPLKQYTSLNNMYSLRLKAQMPRTALDAITMVKDESYWRNLESHGGAWAVMTVEAPHLVLHATSAWYRLFEINSSTIQYTRLESLMSLMGTFTTAYITSSGLAEKFTASNNYVSYADIPGHDLANRDILMKLDGHQQVHGVTCFHLPPSIESGRTQGHNMMCTLHAYPVYSPKAIAQMENNATETPVKNKSFSLRQKFTNYTQGVSGGISSSINSSSKSAPVPVDIGVRDSTIVNAGISLQSTGGVSLGSARNNSSDVASFSPTDYMKTPLLNTIDLEETSNNNSPYAPKSRLMGADFELRQSPMNYKHIKPSENIQPLYFAVLFSELRELHPPPSSKASAAGSAHSGHHSSAHRSDSSDSKSFYSLTGPDGEGDEYRRQNTQTSFQKFRSLITLPSNKKGKGGRGGERNGLLNNDEYDEEGFYDARDAERSHSLS